MAPLIWPSGKAYACEFKSSRAERAIRAQGILRQISRKLSPIVQDSKESWFGFKTSLLACAANDTARVEDFLPANNGQQIGIRKGKQ